MALKLSTLAVVLGAVVAWINSYGLFKPAAFAASARKFPRSIPIGWALTLIATGWFTWYVSQECIADFEFLKPYLYTLFIGVGIGTCIYVQDFLAVRGLSVILLLLGKLMVDTARWTDTPWRLVIITWAYLMVVAWMWFTISPWRLRDLIDWATANESRTRLLSGIRFAFGLFVIALGLLVF